MTTRSELEKLRKKKILLYGNAGTGKTYTAVGVAQTAVTMRRKVLYLDVERGATEELLNLEDVELAGIEHIPITGYNDIVAALNRTDVHLIIIDPFHIIRLSRVEARRRIVAQGFFYMGEKVERIANEETFDLRGYMYGFSNRLQDDLMMMFVQHPADVIATFMTPDDKIQELLGYFDVVLEMKYADQSDNSRKFYSRIEKKRGGAGAFMLDSPLETLNEGFMAKWKAQNAAWAQQTGGK